MGLKELGKEGGRGDAMSHLFPAQNTVDSRASHLMDIPFPIQWDLGATERENFAIRGFSNSPFSNRERAHHTLPISWPIVTPASPTTTNDIWRGSVSHHSRIFEFSLSNGPDGGEWAHGISVFDFLAKSGRPLTLSGDGPALHCIRRLQ